MHPRLASIWRTPFWFHPVCNVDFSSQLLVPSFMFPITPGFPSRAHTRDPQTNLTSVLIFTQSTSYSVFSAPLICRLLALTSQMKTSVLFSSIFFIALSVLSGWMSTLWWSSRVSWGTDLRGYLGERESCSVLGRWKVVVRRILRFFFWWFYGGDG